MKPAPLPAREHERLADLEETKLVYSPAEERFDRLTRLASRVLEVPIALVSLVDDRRQFFKSAVGLEDSESPRELAFCAHAIADGEQLVVEDATTDERFSDNPFVTGSPHVRAYLGKVIHSPSGQPIGTLCVIDSQPRRFTPEQIEALDDLRAIAEAEIGRGMPGPQGQLLAESGPEERRNLLDAETHTWNHDAMAALLLRQTPAADAAAKPFAFGLAHIERLEQLWGPVGPEAAGTALREVAACINRALAEGDALGRFEKNSFALLLAGTDERAARAAAERVRSAVVARPYRAGRLSVSLDATVALAVRRPGQDVARVVEAAMELLQAARRDGRRVCLAVD